MSLLSLSFSIIHTAEPRAGAAQFNVQEVKTGRNKYAHLTESSGNAVRGGLDAKKLQEQQTENQVRLRGILFVFLFIFVQLLSHIQKEKSGKRKPGHGDPQKLVFIMRDVAKHLADSTTIFEGVNLSCFAGYDACQLKSVECLWGFFAFVVFY
jgi:hypothetical protein